MQRWFKVDADDGNLYILRHDEASGGWEIAAYQGAALFRFVRHEAES
jgi:hypothetical protein